MSFNPRDLTQGGQVSFMRLKMFLQINNLISYYVVIFSVLLAITILLVRMSLQNLMNGIIYFAARVVAPFMQNSSTKEVFTVRYYDESYRYTPQQVLSDAYTTWCGQLLKQELAIAGCATLCVAFFITFAVYWYLGRTGRKQSEDEVIGGRVLNDDPKEVTRLMKRRGEASDIRIDALALKKDAEIQNFAMHGTVGSGKSTMMRKILRQLRERGDLVIIYDKGCTFIEDFYDESRDKVLNALDERCPNWDMWEECRTLPELENVSSTLIPSSSGEDPFWQGSARTIFAEGAERMRHSSNRSYNTFLRTMLAIKLDQLRSFLAGTPASTLVDGKIEKTAISIRSVLTNYVKSLRYLQGIDRPGREKFTIRDWMKGQADKSQNGWLFITSDEEHHESLKPLISMWLSIAATSLLAMGENRHRRVWFFYDELTSLHKLPTLPRIIAEARKFGGCFLLGFQSYPQLEETYGPKAAEGMYDLLNTKFFFRSPSAKVAKFVEEDIGETRRKTFSEQTSFGHEQVRDGISFGKDEERINIVSYSDVQSLNDLECFVTLPGDYPVVRLNMKYQGMPKRAEPLLMRDLKTSLDNDIESELSTRDDEHRRQMDALFNPDAAPVTQPSDTTAPATAENPAPVPPAQPAVAEETTTATAATDAPAASSGGGTQQALEQEQPVPAGMSEDGEIVDFAAYDAWTEQGGHTQEQVRREEVNINAPVHHGDTEKEYV
ncbi:type IV conjugative transfer system coupling protein TraD [Enterobacter huaxiensis]|uniref:type IV conjugative transfer system coupling protein TraD n=1 Tax=Enterobacter huaxiensis TaxID=2494702 RepID=UPI0021759590|nr:type IV conjugative transfer system coupling protein TraD [Enterobacter huaxiensis]MCS5452299.1 type IV conjugative transfer system coupling protein TraD [Enterobacter huaxiensis]